MSPYLLDLALPDETAIQVAFDAALEEAVRDQERAFIQIASIGLVDALANFMGIPATTTQAIIDEAPIAMVSLLETPQGWFSFGRYIGATLGIDDLYFVPTVH